jgi:hypothetical protein
MTGLQWYLCGLLTAAFVVTAFVLVRDAWRDLRSAARGTQRATVWHDLIADLRREHQRHG